MSWLRKHVVPKMIQILMMFFIVAVATDDVAVQNVFLNSTLILKQAALYNDDPGNNAERHVWRAPQYFSRSEDNAQPLHLVIRNYLDQFNGLLIPAPPSIFFQPDRAPPDSLR